MGAILLAVAHTTSNGKKLQVKVQYCSRRMALLSPCRCRVGCIVFPSRSCYCNKVKGKSCGYWFQHRRHHASVEKGSGHRRSTANEFASLKL